MKYPSLSFTISLQYTDQYVSATNLLFHYLGIPYPRSKGPDLTLYDVSKVSSGFPTYHGVDCTVFFLSSRTIRQSPRSWKKTRCLRSRILEEGFYTKTYVFCIIYHNTSFK